MDSFNPDSLPLAAPPPAQAQKRIWKFWGTTLWGIFIFVAMFAGQMAAVGLVMLLRDGTFDLSAVPRLVGSGVTISLSVITGVPAVLGALWFAIRPTRTPFADYLALRSPSWKHVILGAIGLALLLAGWELISYAAGREDTPGFMVDVMKSAQSTGALWLMVVAFCGAAPLSEELFARGFLYRGWSETALGPAGAILLSSAAWTALHLQYDWFFFGEIFSIGIWLGYLRYRYNSIWVTIIVHGLNNFAAVVQTLWLASQS
jgi:hypothetical protein